MTIFLCIYTLQDQIVNSRQWYLVYFFTINRLPVGNSSLVTNKNIITPLDLSTHSTSDMSVAFMTLGEIISLYLVIASRELLTNHWYSGRLTKTVLKFVTFLMKRLMAVNELNPRAESYTERSQICFMGVCSGSLTIKYKFISIPLQLWDLGGLQLNNSVINTPKPVLNLGPLHDFPYWSSPEAFFRYIYFLVHWHFKQQ